jgi:hypothetical protein
MNALIPDMPEAEYHAHPALSSSGARLLLPPSCPALFRWQQDNPPPPKDVFDIGTAAHKLVLGVGPELVEVKADDWRTKAAQEERKEARAAGKVALLTADLEAVHGMAAALRQHPVASALFDPARGKAEQSLFWTDERHGVKRRARLDWLPNPTDGRLIVGDFKSTRSAEPKSLAKSCADYGYHQQAAWYLDAVRALELAESAAFVFVAQEKTPPYLITVFQLGSDDLLLGDALNQQALEVYAECSATDTWPSYSDDVAPLSLPAWYVRQHDSLLEAL